MIGQGAYVEGPRRSFSGGAGLVSTASDYARVLQMLLNGGELDGTRLLSRKTVELMTADHITGVEESPGHGFGHGLGLTHDPGRTGRIPSEGTRLWCGFYTTRVWVDPAEALVAVFMAHAPGAIRYYHRQLLHALVNQALE